jgi:putative salt-induced outer membrane protein YdiY
VWGSTSNGPTLTKASQTLTATLAAVLALASATNGAQAQTASEERTVGWFYTAEVTGVWTAGNSESNTLGFASGLRRVWPRSQIKFSGGAIRTESGITTRFAEGSPDDFAIRKDTDREKTAESYYFRGRYDYQLSKRFYTFAGGDWLRNTFAGIDSRTLFATGAGNTWIEDDRTRFNTDYGLTYTFQEDVIANPFISTNFPGLRAAYDFWHQLTGSTEFQSTLTVDLNLDNTDDVRFDLLNELPIAISSKLAFKPSLQLLWRNQPSLTEIDLVDAGGIPTGAKVRVPLEELDSFFKAALVVKL